MALPIYVERTALTRSPLAPAAISPPYRIPIVVKPDGTFNGDLGIGNPVPGDGLQMGQLKALLVTVVANPTFVLAGGGFLACWVWDQNFSPGLWTRAADFDLSMTWPGAVTPQQARMFPTLRFPVRGGSHILFVANGITLTPNTGAGSADVLIKLIGFDGQFPS